MDAAPFLAAIAERTAREHENSEGKKA